MRVWLRSGWTCAMGAIVGASWIASSAGAASLTYGVVAAESDLSLRLNAQAFMDVTPDLTEGLPGGDDFPYTAALNSVSNTTPSPSSHVVADVGLPGGFDNGAHGISFSELVIQALAPSNLSGFGFVSVPLDLTGSSNQLVLFDVVVSYLSIVLDSPLTSSLTPTGNANEWLWAGLANVTISGEVGPYVNPFGVTLGIFPFSQQATIPLAGTFSGIPTGTQITVGIPLGALEDEPLPLPPIEVSLPLDLLQLGLITGTFKLTDLTLVEFSSDVVYRNVTPIPEPGTALLLGLGLAGLAVRRIHSLGR